MFVVADEFIVPIALLLKANVTEIPSGTLFPLAVVTVAWILDVPPVVKVDGVAVSAIFAGAVLVVVGVVVVGVTVGASLVLTPLQEDKRDI